MAEEARAEKLLGAALAFARAGTSITEEQWQAMAKGALRKIAAGEGDVSEETREVARKALKRMEARG